MNFLSKFLSKVFKNEDDRTRLQVIIIPSFIIHCFAAILALLLVFTMTRGLGSKQYGIFTYCISVVTLIVNLATSGICILVLRETPSLLSTGKMGRWKGLHKWSVLFLIKICTVIALFAATFIGLFTFYFHILKETVYTIPLLLAMTSVPLMAIMNYFAASLRGQHKIVISLLPDNIVKPLLFLISVGALFLFSVKFNVLYTVLIYGLALGGAALFAIVAFYRNKPFKGIPEEYDISSWKKVLKSFLLLQVIMSINSRIDILMLGYLKDSSQVGVYGVADMIASKVLLILQILNLITAPFISRLHSLGEMQKLQRMITKVTRWVFIISLPLYLFVVLLSKLIMSYFGSGFESGQVALIIISSGQLINIFFGPVANFAVMTGNQKFNIIFSAISILINIFLNLLLTPALGFNGTAIATSVAIITWNTGLYLSIRKKTGIRTWVLG